jgi:toxin ParE1/3/4
MNRFILSPRADADLQAIWDYIGIQNDSPQSALEFLNRLSRKFKILAEEPLLGELREDLRPNLRIFTAENYVILYYPLSDGVEIVGIIHGARDLDALFLRGDR